MEKRNYGLLWLGLVALLLIGSSMLFWQNQPALSAPPPLPTMTPTPGPVPPVSLGAIALRVKPTDVKLWTVVQWQDGEGAWHTVEGWRAELDLVAKSEGWKWWFFGSELFGRGPFRWLVYTPGGEKLLATSDSFMMPDSDGQTTVVHVFLSE